MGESWPRSPVQTERSEVCTSDRGQDSLIQTDLARLIRCLLYGQTRNEKDKKFINFICLPARAQALCWLTSVTSLQSKRDQKSSFIQTSSMNEEKITVLFIRAQWKSLCLNNNLWKVTKSATNFNACLCLDRSAISFHSTLRSSTDHQKKMLMLNVQPSNLSICAPPKLPEAGFVGLWRHFAVLQWKHWLGFLLTERMYLAHDSGQQTFLAVTSEMPNGSCRGFSNSYDCLAVQRSLAERLLRGVVHHWSNPNGVIRNLLLVCVIEFGCSKGVFEELAISFFPRGLSRYHTLSFGFRRWFMAR